MLTKKFITFGKILSLLLLISFSVVAKTVSTTNEFQNQRKVTVNKTEYSFHKNMLQPQVARVTIISEHAAKLPHFGSAVLFYSNNVNLLLLQPLGEIREYVQDENRCESVSRLLFPFHYFW